MAPCRLSLDQKLEIVDKFKSGWSTRVICNHINTTDDTVSMDQIRRLIKRYRCGYFIPELAAQGIVTESAARHVVDTSKSARIALCSDVVSNNDRLEDCLFAGICSVRLPPCTQQQSTPTIELHMAESSETTNPASPAIDDSEQTTQQLHVTMQPEQPPEPLIVNVWGIISRRGINKYVIYEGPLTHRFYVSNMLPLLLQTIQSDFLNSHRFVHGNDSVSRSRPAAEFMTQNGINCWKWPAESKDLNPTKTLWKHLKSTVARHRPQTKSGLVKCIETFLNKDVTLLLQNKLIDDISKTMLTINLMTPKRPAFAAPKRLLSIAYAPLVYADMEDDNDGFTDES